MQLRSVSVENLENILKRTFQAALKDSSEYIFCVMWWYYLNGIIA